MGRYEEAENKAGGMGGGSFVRVEGKMAFAFRGKPVIYMAKPFVDAETGREDPPKKKALQNVVGMAEGSKPEVIDLNSVLWDQLKKLDEYGHVDRFWLVIERKGAGKQTKWSVTAGKEITPEQKTKLEALDSDLHDIEEIAQRISFKGGSETTLPAKSTNVPSGGGKPDPAAMKAAAESDAL